MLGVAVALGQIKLLNAFRKEDTGMFCWIGGEEDGRERMMPVRRSAMKVVVSRWMEILVIQM